jgi:leucyl aminopeptidase (aminopeptidase T)
VNRQTPRIPTLVALILVLGLAATGWAADPDYDAVAASVVNESLGVRPGEVVVITGNAVTTELMGALQVAVSKAGGQPILLLNIPEANKRVIMETPMEHLKQLPTAGFLLNRIADAFINTGAVKDPTLFADVPEERLAATREARAPLNATFANIRTRNVSLGQTGGIPTEAYAASLGADYEEVSEIFWQAVAVSPADLAASAGALAGKMARAEIKLTSDVGTDLTLTVDEQSPRINAGRVSDVTAPTGPSSVWLPAGEAYGCVKTGSASGTLVVPYTNFRGLDIENLRMTFEDGALTGLTADTNGDKLQEYLDSTDDATKQVSVVDFGLNPHSRTPEGSRVYSWEMGGMVTVGLGNNTWAGGDNLAEGEFTVHVSGLTATVNGETVVEGGVLVE